MSPAQDSPRFGRVITAMVTPFDDAGELDLPAAVALARWLASHGSDGLVLTGSTGESSVLSDDETADIVAYATEHGNKAAADRYMVSQQRVADLRSELRLRG